MIGTGDRKRLPGLHDVEAHGRRDPDPVQPRCKPDAEAFSRRRRIMGERTERFRRRDTPEGRQQAGARHSDDAAWRVSTGMAQALRYSLPDRRAWERTTAQRTLRNRVHLRGSKRSSMPHHVDEKVAPHEKQQREHGTSVVTFTQPGARTYPHPAAETDSGCPNHTCKGDL